MRIPPWIQIRLRSNLAGNDRMDMICLHRSTLERMPYAILLTAFVYVRLDIVQGASIFRQHVKKLCVRGAVVRLKGKYHSPTVTYRHLFFKPIQQSSTPPGHSAVTGCDIYDSFTRKTSAAGLANKRNMLQSQLLDPDLVTIQYPGVLQNAINKSLCCVGVRLNPSKLIVVSWRCFIVFGFYRCAAVNLVFFLECGRDLKCSNSLALPKRCP